MLADSLSITLLHCSYQLDKHNAALRAKLGKAFVATHQYLEAIAFYEEAIRDCKQHAVGSGRGGAHDGRKLIILLISNLYDS